MKRAKYDVIVVGGRLAGAATAMLLAQAGAKVLVLERQARGRDTLSTHAMMRGGVILLSRWGLLRPLLDAGTPLITKTTFHYGDAQLAIPIRSDNAAPGLLAPRRTILDPMLADAAGRAGADMRYGHSVHELLHGPDGRVCGVVCDAGDGSRRLFRASLVIGADGIGSTVARLVRSRDLARGQHSMTAMYGYLPNLPNDGFHWMYRHGMAGGLIPTNDGLTCTFAALPTAVFDAQHRQDPANAYRATLAALLPSLPLDGFAGRPMVFRGRPGYLREAYGPGWALVGDAAYFRDPITAHGMTDALRDAEGLAEAVLRDNDYDLRRYQSERDSIALPLLEATDRIASSGWTMEELKAAHLDLNAAMKAEVAIIATRTSAAHITEETIA